MNLMKLIHNRKSNFLALTQELGSYREVDQREEKDHGAKAHLSLPSHKLRPSEDNPDVPWSTTFPTIKSLVNKQREG